MGTIIEEPETKGIEENEATQVENEQKPIYLSKYGAYLPPFNPQAVIAALDSLLEGDEEEQRETFEYLKRVLDEDRPSYRKLFP